MPVTRQSLSRASRAFLAGRRSAWLSLQWSRERLVLMAAYWLVALALLLATRAMPRGPSSAARVAVLGMVMFAAATAGAPRRSLADDEHVRDMTNVAGVLGMSVPSHPVWWREGRELWGGAGQVLVLALSVLVWAALAFATFVAPTVSYASGYATLVVMGAAPALVAVIAAARHRRRQVFRELVLHELAHRTGEGDSAVAPDGTDAAAPERRDAPLDLTLTDLYAVLQRMLEAEQGSERRGVMLNVALSVFGVIAGFLLSLLVGPVR